MTRGAGDSSLHPDVEAALSEFRSQVMPVDHPELALARRNRTVSHLRALQARAVVRGQNQLTWRKRWLAAALVLLPTAALAGTWAALQRPPQDLLAPDDLTQGTARSTPEKSVAERSVPPVMPSAPGGVPAVRVEGVQTSAPVSVAEGRRASVRHAPQNSPAASILSTGKGTSADFAIMNEASRAGTSTLAAENSLMQSAMSAVRAGNDEHAVRALDDFLTRYPRSPLGQNAGVERSRALERLGNEPASSRSSATDAPRH